MKSPESMSPQEKKWQRRSAIKCIAVYDILAKLEKEGSLPEGKTTDDPSLKKSENIMDYAERVLSDEQFWASVPEDVSTELAGHTVKKDDLKKQLSGIIEESK